ncbi:hypothetical protein PR202_ga26152 [Eleusine coracana subsp. coracana]|uniref:Uncharacterized protein n=1 Tax=Eleusine coracana subsp. coracana TaxID=191504 RepID=A0AAV5DCU1_ELECO|nr:hypothetical protein PR202_ga26152 [Eleusine coracana subsp. coracana]
MVPTGLFGWASPHVQPLTPVSEVSEPPESPSPYGDGPAGDAGVGAREGEGAGAGEEEVEDDEVEPPPAAVSFWRLFEFADGLDWALMAVGALAAATHGAALVVYLHYFGRALNLLDSERVGSALNRNGDELLQRFKEHALYIIYIAAGVFVAGWIEVSCWIFTGERQTAVIRSKYVQAISYIRTLYAFTNETLAKYSYATSLQATLRYGILISLVQGIGLGFTYGLAICSCALQLWVGRHLIARGKADGGEVVVALFAVILSGLGSSFGWGKHKEFESRMVKKPNWSGDARTSFIEFEHSRKNIAYGRSATFDQIEEAAKTAHAHGFISSLEKGYETQVGRAGLALTDEQKIKISIARAVLSNPSILLLDEVTGGLDFEAEKAVQEALDVLMLGRSTIIIARRLSLIKNADYIAVMEEGHLVEMDTNRNSHDSPKDRSPPSEQSIDNGIPMVAIETERTPSIKRQDSFEMKLPDLPKVDVHPIQRQSSKNSEPDSPISPLLTSDPKNERSHSQTFSRPHSEQDDTSSEQSELDDVQEHKPPSFWRLAGLSIAEWPYALLGTIGAAIFGSFNPLLAYTIALIVSAYYRIEAQDMHHEVNRWCLFIVGMGVITVLVNWLQHFYFGIMGEKMTERIRRMMFSAMLRNEVGWFDKDENNADTLSMRLANDATFVRAAFSNRLSIFIQDTAAVSVAFLIGMLLEWRVALVALATLPVLVISAIAQKLWLAGFSKGIQEMHRKASLVLEDAVRNIYTVVAFCAGNKIMELYRLHLGKILKQSLVHGLAIGFGFGFSQFLLFACNALLLWYTAISVNQGRLTIATGLKEYVLFSFASFALVEPFGLAPYILKRRKSLTSVFEIIDREPKIDPDDTTGLKPPNVYGSIEFKNVDFSYPARPEILVLSNFNLKVSGGQTVAVVGVSGSGKSTIISLIERFYDPVSGQVLLDGRDLKSFNLRWLRSHMGLIQQEPVIFSTTIRENIIYARHNATEAEMKEAARIANAHHFISSLPHGYDTHVGMRGVDLTPGQKQRIAIARVVLKNAPILLLDEASSAIESESSRVVQEALDTLVMGNKTTILIAHRQAMMKHVDNIVVLNGGRIVEQGTHDSLMDLNGLYVRLMQPHFGKGLRQHRLM